MSPPEELSPDLRALVRLSAGLALGADEELRPFLEEAASSADPGEVEEALLQSYLFLGYPAALNALAAWRRCYGGAPRAASEPDDWDGWGRRGESVCREVYGGAYPGLRANISALSPEMDRWMVVEGYGKVLGRPGLALWRRECCIASMLMVLGTAPQLRSHLRGALRTGAPRKVLDQVVREVMPLVPTGLRLRAEDVWTEVRNRWENT